MMPRATKAALASPNVVALPTAAPRKVNNHRFTAQFWAAKEARANSPFQQRYRNPVDREAEIRARAMMRVEKSALFFVSLMILDAIPHERRHKMIEDLALRAVVSPAARQAVEIIRSTTLNLGEQRALLNAMERLGGEASS